ncbi:MAG: GrpB family protein [Alkalibacterium sp.]|nr:GrpB family protein [Alkalibacterium sp.]
MPLGLKRDEVRIVSHDKTWENEFQEVKKTLLKVASLEDHQIEHVGSTAIKDIHAKPVIDILVGIQSIDDDLTQVEKDLRRSGFYRLKVERPGEMVFARFTDESFESKTHYIHLTTYQGELWDNLIYFKNYLNENEEARKEYERLKLNFVAEKSEGIEEYTDMKEGFVNQVLSTKP